MKFKAILLAAKIARAFHSASTAASDLTLSLERRVYNVFKAAKEVAVTEAHNIAANRAIRSFQLAVQASQRADDAWLTADYHEDSKVAHAESLVRELLVR